VPHQYLDLHLLEELLHEAHEFEAQRKKMKSFVSIMSPQKKN